MFRRVQLITTYNALRNSGAMPGDLVAVQGIGGLGHLGVQFANKFGYNVAAIGRSLTGEYTPAANAVGGRMNRTLLYLSIVFVGIGGSFAQNQQEKLKMPGPEVQNLMLGTWSTQVKYEPTSEMPNGGTGAGTEIWRPGPGSRSLVVFQRCGASTSNRQEIPWR
jgi:hypothetical protein